MIPWENSPNASHIDRIIYSLNANLSIWHDLYESDTFNRNLHWKTLEHLEYKYYYAWCDTWIKLARSTWFKGEYLGWAASLCLFEYPESSYMLDSDPGELEMLAMLGDKRAILLLPACLALNKESKLNEAVA